MSLNLTLSPPQNQFIAKPGATVISTLNVTNLSHETVFLNSSIESWQPQGYSGGIVYNPSLASDQISFSLSNSDLELGQAFRLEPNQSRQLVIKIKTNNNITFGDYYYTVFVNQLPSDNINPTQGSSVYAKVGSHLMLSVSQTDQIKSKLKVSDFTSLPAIKDSFLTPVKLSAIIDNPDIYFSQIQGNLVITKGAQTIKEFTLEPQNVLANFSRQINYSLSPPLWPGKYFAKLTVNQTTTETSFYVFPFSFIIGLVLFFVIGMAVYRHTVGKSRQSS